MFGDDFIVVSKDTVASEINYYSMDTSCSTTMVETDASTDGIRGIAIASDTASDSDIYMIDGSNNQIEKVELGSASNTDGSRNTEIDLGANGHQGKQRGLDFINWDNGNDWFVVGYTTGGNSAEHVKVIDSTGSKQGGWTLNSDEYNPVFNEEENDDYRVWTMDNNGNGGGDIRALAIEDLWAGGGSRRAAYSDGLAPDSDITNVDLTEVSGTIDAPSAKDSNADVDVQIKDANGNWQTIKQYSEGSGSGQSFTVGESALDNDGAFDSMDVFEFRVRFRWYKVKHGDGFDPALKSLSWKYEYYEDDGTVTSTRVSVKDAKNFKYVKVNGSSSGDASVDVQLLDNSKSVLVQDQIVDLPHSLDISGVSTSNDEVYVRIKEHTSGSETPELTGWSLSYEGNPSPNITKTQVTYNKSNTTKKNVTDINSTVGSVDTFNISEVNQSADNVTWKLDGAIDNETSVTGNGPFSYTKKWGIGEVGENTINGEISNANGTDSVTWNVNVTQSESTVTDTEENDDGTETTLAIIGDDSYSASSGTFETQQTFEVSDNDSAEIDVTLSYNDSVITVISGPESAEVTSGSSITWEFLVTKTNYDGRPITIEATYTNLSASKTIQVSSASGGLVGTGTDESILSNAWLGIPFGDLLDRADYILIQTVLAGGLVAGIWLHHFRIIPLPGFVAGLLNWQGWMAKVGTSLIVGTLVAGVQIWPWWTFIAGGTVGVLTFVVSELTVGQTVAKVRSLIGGAIRKVT